MSTMIDGRVGGGLRPPPPSLASAFGRPPPVPPVLPPPFGRWVAGGRAVGGRSVGRGRPHSAPDYRCELGCLQMYTAMITDVSIPVYRCELGCLQVYHNAVH